MVGGALSGTVGTQQGLAAAGGAAPGAGDSVFGPGVIGEGGGMRRACESLACGAHFCMARRRCGAIVSMWSAAGSSTMPQPGEKLVSRCYPPSLVTPSRSPTGMDPTLGEPEGRHGPLPRSSGNNRVVGSVAEELAAAQGTSQVGEARKEVGGPAGGSGLVNLCCLHHSICSSAAVHGRACKQMDGCSPAQSRLCPTCNPSIYLPGLSSPSIHLPGPIPPLLPIPLQTVLEGDLVNLGVTSPAAALALGLMYLQVMTLCEWLAGGFRAMREALSGPAVPELAERHMWLLTCQLKLHNNSPWHVLHCRPTTRRLRQPSTCQVGVQLTHQSCSAVRRQRLLPAVPFDVLARSPSAAPHWHQLASPSRPSPACRRHPLCTGLCAAGAADAAHAHALAGWVGWGAGRSSGSVRQCISGLSCVVKLRRFQVHHVPICRLHALLSPCPAVMWDSIQPTEEWLQAQLPPLLRGPLARLMAEEGGGAPHADYEALAQVRGWSGGGGSGGGGCAGGVHQGRLYCWRLEV